MRTASDNFRVNKFQDMLESANGNPAEMQKVIQRISNALASFTLGRNFNEDVDVFFNRKPELKEVKDWAKTVELTQKFELVNY